MRHAEKLLNLRTCMAKSEIYNNESLHKAERKEMIRECRKDKMKIMAEKILIITAVQ